LQRQFHLSEGDCDQTLQWLAAHGHLTVDESGGDAVIRACWHED
jgi:hypothetical protein